MASYGHIREIENGLKSINVEKDFETKFAVMKTKFSQVSKLRAAVAEASEVILATDDDREGEAIAWHLCQVLNLSVDTTKRIIFHEITEHALKTAVAAPRTINMLTVHAQQARQILDMIVGYKVSPVLWTYIARTNLSAGRCQSPALRLVYDNYKEIESSPSIMVYSVSGIFTKLNLSFHLSRDLESIEILERFLKETSDAQQQSFIASVSKPKKTSKAPPKPYSTSTLQQAANTELHLSPKDTMYAAQKLYEQGYITYMRTDSKVYSRDFVDKAFEYIKARWASAGDHEKESRLTELLGNLSTFTSGTKNNTNTNVTAAHEAIRPTDISRTLVPQSCHPREHRLYALIHRNTLESLMAPATCQSITMAIQSPYPSDTEYRYTAEQIITPGWKLVGGYDKEAKEYTYFASLISAPIERLIFPFKKIATKCSMRNTKSHYTEAGLVQTLERMGIGRPSTFSSLIEKIQERGYVKVQDVRGKSLECSEYILHEDKKIEKKTEVREIGGENRKLVIQPLGIVVIEFLIEHFAPLIDYEFTKNMELQLDEIEQDGMIWHELCYKCWFDVNSQLQELKERGIVKEEIRIDDNHSYIIGKFGPVIKCVVSPEIHKSLEHSDEQVDDEDETCDISDTDNKQTIIFKPVRKDLDYAKILRGEYSLEYMLGNETIAGESTVVVSSSSVKETATSGGKVLGSYQGNNIIIKTGKYGPYANWGTQNISLRSLLGISSTKTGKYAKREPKQAKSEFDLTLQDVITFIRSQTQQTSTPDTHDSSSSSADNSNGNGDEPTQSTNNSNPTTSQIVRVIDEHSSIRNGRFGPYIFYKTPKMSKPEFIALKGFAQKYGDYGKCDITILKEWIDVSRKKK
jgi:DNA topoisomerase-1